MSTDHQQVDDRVTENRDSAVFIEGFRTCYYTRLILKCVIPTQVQMIVAKLLVFKRCVYLFERAMQRNGKRLLLFTGAFPKWPQRPGLCQVKPRSPEFLARLPFACISPSMWVIFCCFPGTLAGNYIRGGATGPLTYMGC